MPLTILIFLMVNALGPSAEAAEVNTQVEGEGAVNYFYEEHHPRKWNCWGRNSKSEDGRAPSQPAFSRENTGNLPVRALTKGRLGEVLVQNLEWASHFDEEDYTFNVEFKRIKGRNQRLSRRRTCNTRSWRYELDHLTSRIKTSVNLVVPPEVWVLKIKSKVGPNVLERKIDFTNVEPLLGSSGRNITINNSREETSHYFFVKPGEELKLETQLSHSQDGEIFANFEITFIGFNRCISTINDFKKQLGFSDAAPFDSRLVLKIFDSTRETLEGKGLVNSQLVQSATLFMGCLTSPRYTDELLYNSETTKLREVLKAMVEIERKVAHYRASSPNGASTSLIEAKPVMVLSQMSRFALSQSLLSGLRPLCETYPIEDIHGRQQASSVNGYTFFPYQLDKIDVNLGLTNTQQGLDQYHLDWLKTFESMAKPNLTYRQVFEQNRDRLHSLARDYKGSTREGIAQQAFKLFSDLPPVRPTRGLVELSQSLENVIRLDSELHFYIQKLFQDRFFKQLNTTIDFREHLATADSLGREYGVLRDRYFKLRKLFGDSELSYEFRHNVDRITNDHLQNPLEWMRRNLPSFIEDFIKLQEQRGHQSGGSMNLEEIKQCVRRR